MVGTDDGSALITAQPIFGRVEIVQALIDAKALIDHANARGWTAVTTAVVLGNGDKEHTAVIEALVKAGADVDFKDRQDSRRSITPASAAIRRSCTSWRPPPAVTPERDQDRAGQGSRQIARPMMTGTVEAPDWSTIPAPADDGAARHLPGAKDPVGGAPGDRRNQRRPVGAR